MSKNWIAHTTGKRPVSKKTLVKVKFRDGGESLFWWPASDWSWGESGENTIVSYRVNSPK